MMSIRIFALIFSLVLLPPPFQDRFQVTLVECIRRAERQKAASTPSKWKWIQNLKKSRAKSEKGALTSVNSADSEERSTVAIPISPSIIIRFFTAIFTVILGFVGLLFQFRRSEAHNSYVNRNFKRDIAKLQAENQAKIAKLQAERQAVTNSEAVADSEAETHTAVSLDELEGQQKSTSPPPDDQKSTSPAPGKSETESREVSSDHPHDTGSDVENFKLEEKSAEFSMEKKKESRFTKFFNEEEAELKQKREKLQRKKSQLECKVEMHAKDKVNKEGFQGNFRGIRLQNKSKEIKSLSMRINGAEKELKQAEIQHDKVKYFGLARKFLWTSDRAISNSALKNCDLYILIVNHLLYFLAWCLLAHAFKTESIAWFRGRDCNTTDLAVDARNKSGIFYDMNSTSTGVHNNSLSAASGSVYYTNFLSNLKFDVLYMHSKDKAQFPLLQEAVNNGCISEGFFWLPENHQHPSYINPPANIFLAGVFLWHMIYSYVSISVLREEKKDCELVATVREEGVQTVPKAAVDSILLFVKKIMPRRISEKLEAKPSFLIYIFFNVPMMAFTAPAFAAGCRTFAIPSMPTNGTAVRNLTGAEVIANQTSDNAVSQLSVTAFDYLWNCEVESRMDSGVFPLDKAAYIGFYVFVIMISAWFVVGLLYPAIGFIAHCAAAAATALTKKGNPQKNEGFFESTIKSAKLMFAFILWISSVIGVARMVKGAMLYDPESYWRALIGGNYGFFQGKFLEGEPSPLDHVKGLNGILWMQGLTTVMFLTTCAFQGLPGLLGGLMG